MRKTGASVFSWLLAHRTPFVILFHLALVIASSYMAMRLRFDGEIPARTWSAWLWALPWLLVLRGLAFGRFRLYQGLWRYASIWDLRNIVGAVFVSSVLHYGLIHWVFGWTIYPRSVFVIDAALLILLLGGARMGRRIYREFHSVNREKRVLIYGAGDAGEMIVRDMRNNGFYDYEPIGFVDDDRSKVGQLIHGVPVLGTRQDIAPILMQHQPHEVLVAIPRAEPAEVRSVVRAFEPFKIPIKTLPNLRDLMDGRVQVTQIRSLQIEDLLARAPIGLDSEPVRHIIEGRRVLVTGAGGSIGSELCRQIARLKPATLTLFERYENNLYTIVNDLSDSQEECRIHPVIGDVTDRARLEAVFASNRPEIVFHAAAHKHVPLMEHNPCEAIKNNVIGTRRVIEASTRFGVGRFLLISSDKAVNPVNVMGATKRVAELLVQHAQRASATHLAAVRFGNVLGSNGSVVPRFLQQIDAGGPVTVTDPEIQRFFMLIPEAVQLVLHAAAHAETGSLFVLEMGDQIKLLDLARDLIRLSGYVPDEDVAIEFTGLRPGEKLFEELIGRGETAEPSAVEKILRLTPAPIDRPSMLASHIAGLEQAALAGDMSDALAMLQVLVPTFVPQEMVTRKAAEMKRRRFRGARPEPVTVWPKESWQLIK